MCRPILLLLLIIGLRGGLSAEPFSILVYNAENLFDADGIALFDDYKPAGPDNPTGYTPAHFLTKLTNTTTMLQQFGAGRGPDIILFQEFEGDQTPERWDGDLVGFLTASTGVSVELMLTENFNEELGGIPAEIWLYKMMADAGMHEYFISVAEYTDASDRPMAHVNVTFSRFPIVESRTHHSPGARGTLETKLDVNGYPLYLFNCHWKSGASNAMLEPVRVGNARVVRDRIDQILHQNPNADIIVGGDLNSQYNQRAVFPEMKETGINSILGSQGDELAMVAGKGPDLYNLWFELPEEQRGSDIFRGSWGTLMHLIVSRGLYDFYGVQYIDNSFAVAKRPGFNADPITGLPIRWGFAGNGSGFSDHFPILAWFQIVRDDDKERFLQLKDPGRDATGPDRLPPIDFAGARLDLAPNASRLARKSPLQGHEHYGQVLFVEAVVSGERPFRIEIGDEEFQIWAFDQALREKIYQDYAPGDRFTFFGQLGMHRGNWQFVIHDESWLNQSVSAVR